MGGHPIQGLHSCPCGGIRSRGVPPHAMPAVHPDTGSGTGVALAAPVRLHREPYPGLEGVLERMGQIVGEWRARPELRRLVLRITQGVDMRNFPAIGQRVYDFIRRNVRYTRDPHGVEQLQTPEATLRMGAGDCDDMAILAASMLQGVGVPTRFRVVGRQPGRFQHVFTEFRDLQGRWWMLDPTEKKQAAGVRPAKQQGAFMADMFYDDLGYGLDARGFAKFLRQMKNTVRDTVRIGTNVATGNIPGAVSAFTQTGVARAVGIDTEREREKAMRYAQLAQQQLEKARQQMGLPPTDRSPIYRTQVEPVQMQPEQGGVNPLLLLGAAALGIMILKK